MSDKAPKLAKREPLGPTHKLEIPNDLIIPDPPKDNPRKKIQKKVSLKRLMSGRGKKKSEYRKEISKKATQYLETFKSSNQLSSQIPENEKIRQRVRENLFYGLAFGFEEIRYLSKKGAFNPEGQGNAEELVEKKSEEITEYVKTLTLEIEANMYHRFQKNVQMNSQYSHRSKAIAMNLKHSQNFQLRKDVLTK